LNENRATKTEVNKSVTAFDTLKVGDSIHARLTKAIAISVEKPWPENANFVPNPLIEIGG
jgi:hypothetical protein